MEGPSPYSGLSKSRETNAGLEGLNTAAVSRSWLPTRPTVNPGVQCWVEGQPIYQPICPGEIR